MPVALNSAALDAYRQLKLEDKNTMLQVGEEGVLSKGTYKGALSALTRSAASKVENNQTRTAFLKALGKAFDLKGMTEENGKVTFSKDFMDRLENILGKDFKRSDFGMNAEGEVTSGRPLTMRRVEAIVKKADFVGAGRFDVAVYERKLNHMMKEMGVAKWDLAKLEKEGGSKRELKTIVLLMRTLEYLKGGNDCRIELVFDYQVEMENYDLGSEDGEALEAFDESKYSGPRYVYRDPVTGETMTSRTINDWQRAVQLKTGMLFHQDNAYSIKQPSKIAHLNTYVIGMYELYVKKTIDVFFACEAAGKVNEFKNFLCNDPGVCVEGRIDRLNQFEGLHLIQKSAEDIHEAAEIERIAKGVADNGKAVNTEQLIFAEIEAMINKEDATMEDAWETFAPTVKQNLVGKMAVIVHPVESKDGDGVYNFEPVMKDGAPEVRPLTAQDIDALGPTCLSVITGV